MNDSARAKAGLVYNIDKSEVTAAMVYGLQWTASTLWELSKTQAAQGNQIKVNTDGITDLRATGSPGLRSHEAEDTARIAAHNARIEKLEAAVIILQQTPGELKGIAAEMRGLREGQMRI